MENLATQFGAGTRLARESVGALYRAVVERSPGCEKAFADWVPLMAGLCGHDFHRPAPWSNALAKRFGIASDDLNPAPLLFAVQTYYAWVVRLLVADILAASRGMPRPSEAVAGVRSAGELRRQFHRLGSVGEPDGIGLVELGSADPYAWPAEVESETLSRVVTRLAERFGRFDVLRLPDSRATGRDLLKSLYENLFDRRVRHRLGEYYTPDWLAQHVLDEAGYSGLAHHRLLDPACGSGTFLLLAIARIRKMAHRPESEAGADPDELLRTIVRGVVGFDLNPLAVLSARANYLISVSDLLRESRAVEIPVVLRDSILADDARAGPHVGPFDFVVGNPPWIAWDDLPNAYREATKPLWQAYGLFSLSGTEAMHGGGKKDLSVLMLYVAADRYLKSGGRLAMVVTQTLFQSKGAGDGFRRFRLGSQGPRLGVLRVDDLVGVRPFGDAANWTATVVLEKDLETTYPVPYVRWSHAACRHRVDASRDATYDRIECLARPIDPARRTSPWLVWPPGLDTDPGKLVGPSDYTAHLGANTGGANGVYWVDLLGVTEQGVLIRNIPGRGKRSVERVEHVVEPDLLYPLVRWADVKRYRAEPSAHLLLVQDPARRKGIDEAVMRGRYPRTLSYFERFDGPLRDRAAYKRYQSAAPFYSMYNVGPYTVAPIKVVWRRMDRRINAAVVEPVDDPVLATRPVVPQETCVLVAVDSIDEADYLCATLNSSTAGFLVTSHSVAGGKGFGTPSVLDFLRLQRYRSDNRRHVQLAAAGREARRLARRGNDLAPVSRRIDRLAGSLWGLFEAEVEAIGRVSNGKGQ